MVMCIEHRSERLWMIPGRGRGRLSSLLGVMMAVGLVSGTPALGQEAFRGSLGTEVVGPDQARPGGTATFLIAVRGADPRATVTIYEQLGSNLSYVGDRRDCVISALPVVNLPGADPGAPGENRMACMLLTDDQGYASLILETRVSTRPTRPGPDSTTRSVVAIEDAATVGVGPVAFAEIKLIDDHE
jgi:hypothetical protein